MSVQSFDHFGGAELLRMLGATETIKGDHNTFGIRAHQVAAMRPHLVHSTLNTSSLPSMSPKMRTIEDSERAFDSMTQAQVAGFLVLASPAVYSERGARLAELALQHRLPSMFGFEENAKAGGLTSYSADILDLYRRSAAYIDKILKGANPSELPVERASSLYFFGLATSVCRYNYGNSELNFAIS
jgi:ABC transporter substrate binding protein